ncbi:HAD hydrolase family protein [Bacillus thuringiensis]|nr:HAD hydrolase family protein [Bacillus thuringiensis]
MSDLDGTLLRSDKTISESESYVYVK